MTQKGVYVSYRAPDDGVRDNVCNLVIETASILEHGWVCVLFTAEKMARLNKLQSKGNGLSGMHLIKAIWLSADVPQSEANVPCEDSEKAKVRGGPRSMRRWVRWNLQKTTNNFFSISMS